MEIIVGLLEIIVIVLAANSAGGFLKRVISPGESFFCDSLLEEIISIALGLIIISYCLFFLVSMRWISREILWFFLLFCVFLAMLQTKALYGRAICSIKKFQPGTDGWMIFLIFYFVFIIALTFLPPSVRDELIYHLEIPKKLIESEGNVVFMNNIYAYFPGLADMFFLLGLGTAGEAAAKLFHVLSGFLLMLAVFRGASIWLSKKYAVLAVFIFLSVPSVMVIMSWAYVDLTYVFYAFLSFLILLEYIKKRNLRYIFLAGIFFGATICIKYTGLQLIALGFCLTAYARLKNKDLPLLKPVFFLAVVSLSLALPYFIKNLYITGWPLFPFETPFFQLKEGFNWDSTRASLFLRFLQAFGIPLDGGRFLSSIMATVFVFVLGQFNQPQFYEGIVGPVFLLIPILLFRKKLKADMNLVIFFSLLFMFYWAVTTRQVRFLLPVVPFLSILLAYGLEINKKKWLIFPVYLFIILNVCLGLNEILKKDPFEFWSGRLTREEYLGRQNRVYPIYAAANKLLKEGDTLYLIEMKNYVYYLDHPWESDFVFERFRVENLLNQNPTVQEISNYFDRLNITHLMVSHSSIMNEKTGLNEEAKRLFYKFLEEQSVLVAEHESYGIHQLKKSPNNSIFR